jgi:hypothetical protein
VPIFPELALFCAIVARQPKTLRDIRRDMYKQREWRSELDRMKVSHVVGLN